MNPVEEESMGHPEAWDLIPWLANERASEEEARRFAKHAASCEACRRELEQQKRLCILVASDSRLDSVPGASFQRLWTKLEAVPTSTLPAKAVDAAATRSSTKRSRGQPLLRALIAAMIVEAVGLAVLGGMLWSQPASRQEVANYKTLSSPPVASSGAAVRAVFSPSLTLSELETLLNQLDLQIVSGPTQSGVYSLAPTQAGIAADLSAKRLRSQPGVRFAEPIALAPEPAP